MFTKDTYNRLTKIGIFIVIMLIALLFPFRYEVAKADLTPLMPLNGKTNYEGNDVLFSKFSVVKQEKKNLCSLEVRGIVQNKVETNKKYIYVISFYNKNRIRVEQIKSQVKELEAKEAKVEASVLYLSKNNLNNIVYYRMNIKVVDVNGTSTGNQQSSTGSGQQNVGNRQSSTGSGQQGVENQNGITIEKAPSKIDEYKSYEYVIDKYNVDIKVNEDNSLDITETITAFFNVPKHGIVRKIPLVSEMVRADGSTNRKKAKIKNVQVNNESSSSRTSEYYSLKIGSANKTVTGEQVYTIKYIYDLGRDKLKDKDEFYFNIIGPEWDTVIGNVTFRIDMPKEFDGSKAGISAGAAGTVGVKDGNEKTKSTGDSGKNNTSFKVEGKVIKGEYGGILQPNEALTVRTELPEGYFVVKNVMGNKLNYLMFIIPVAGVIIAFILWLLFGRDDKVIETVEFYPPEGYNSLEVGMLYKGRAENQDVVSLLVYLANKGYIKIVEKEKNNLFDKNTFKIVKVKPYDGDNENERIFMDGLFAKKVTLNSLKTSLVNGNMDIEDESSEEVTAADLRYNFYKYMDRITSNVNGKAIRNMIFEGNTTAKSIIVALMMIVTYLAITLIPLMNSVDISEMGEMVMILLFFIPFIAVAFIRAIPLFFKIIWCSALTFMILVTLTSLGFVDAILSEKIFITGFVLGIACIIGMGIFFKLMPKRTPLGNELLGKILGFKRFLETAEKSKLEAMVSENPSYFYDILPFTYVLGVSSKWIKKFEVIGVDEPDWYVGMGAGFSVGRFGSFMDDAMSATNNAMSSSPSSHSGSGGGGGVSGGGAGGGGGSSW